ncbi:MAG: hypothetical protein ACP5U1_01840 [Desulfomonilaceae bacterium]
MRSHLDEKKLIYHGISESQVRVFFWVSSLIFACSNAYTTRFFMNDDSTAYIEIGEAIKSFHWHDVANFTFSPMYGLLIASFESVLKLTAFNEIPWIKVLNCFIFVMTLVSLEILMRFLKREYMANLKAGQNLFPWPLVQAFFYSIFLVTTLVSIRIRLINPDMLVYCLILLCFSTIMWIRENSEPLFKYPILGGLIGIGYLSKAYLFLFSPVLLAMAAFSIGTFKKCAPRIVLTLLCMLLIMSPLLLALSIKKGSFTYGEGGRHVYSILVGGHGKPINPGKILDSHVGIYQYEYGNFCTRPSSFDVCYWTIGVKPKYDHIAHAKMFFRNLALTVSQSRWILLIIGWAIFQMYNGSLRIGPLKPISVQILFFIPAFLGIALFALISTEPRYVAPFFFLGSVGLIFGISRGENKMVFKKWGTSDLGLLLLIICLFGTVINSSIDQAIRGLVPKNGKPSYHENYENQVSIGNFLPKLGLKHGDQIAMIGNSSIQWARMAGVRITGEIEDPEKFFLIDSDERFNCLTLLKNVGIRAVIAHGKKWTRFRDEGWILVPGTDSYFVKVL